MEPATNVEAFLSIAGSLASIMGAIWALKEAKKAACFADAAERTRRELMDRRNLAEVAQIHAETKRILNLVARVGPTSTAQLIKGINCAYIAREVETFVAMLLERRGHFSDFYGDRAAELRNDLRTDIEGLAEAKTFEDKKRFGKSIYYRIENFAPVVKELSDAKQEQAQKF
jgi:hypothetical protein